MIPRRGKAITRPFHRNSTGHTSHESNEAEENIMMIRSVALLLVSLSFACGPDGSIGEPQDAGDGGGEVVAEVVVA